MQNKWPAVILGLVIVWFLIALAANDFTSGLIFGAAAGSTTFRDPIFVLLEIGIGLFVRQWWQLLLVSVLVAIAYTMGVASMIGHEPTSISYLGRFLILVVVGSAIALIREFVIPLWGEADE